MAKTIGFMGSIRSRMGIGGRFARSASLRRFEHSSLSVSCSDGIDDLGDLSCK